MHPTETLQTIGPWGWLGWLLAAVVSILLWIVWESDPQMALRRMTAALNEARQTIDQLSAKNTELQNRNSALQVDLHRLEADNRDLHQQLKLLQQANALQGESIARMEKYQRELQDKYDNMTARVMQLEAKLGAL